MGRAARRGSAGRQAHRRRGALRSATTDLPGPGLGATQRRLLLALKRRGRATRAELGAELDYAPATLREHLQSLIGRGLVVRHGTRRIGPGRPEVVYGLARAADTLFPRGEGDVLRDLARFLLERDESDLLAEFFAARVAARRAAARARVAGLTGSARLAEVARILSEEGFMADVVAGAGGRPTLRLAHCPISAVVGVTPLPCRIEEAFVRELLGERLERIEYLPAGASACVYARRPTASAPGSSTPRSCRAARPGRSTPR